MFKKVAIIISPNWRDYAKKYLADCLESISKQDWTGESKIFLIDNETTDESYEFLKLTVGAYCNTPLPYEIIRNKTNDGFAKGNNEAMRVALEQGYDYLILFNMDTVVEPNAVSEMVKAAEDNPPNPPLTRGQSPNPSPRWSYGPLRQSECEASEAGLYQGGVIGAVQARIMLYPEKDKINSLGNQTHFLGFGYCDNYGEIYDRPHPSPLLSKERGVKEIFYPSGAAVLFKAEVLKEVGLFDEEFWMYNEDQDLGWRLWLAGYRCVFAPEAVVYHKYEFSKSIKKYYWMDRNRLIAIFKNYRLPTLFLIAPAGLLMEIGLLFFAARGGWLKEKLAVYNYFFTLSNWDKILRSRQEAQKLRKIKDREMVKMISGRILYQEIDSVALRLANVFLNLYWAVIRRFIFW